jgi:hypothetical protein
LFEQQDGKLIRMQSEEYSPPINHASHGFPHRTAPLADLSAGQLQPILDRSQSNQEGGGIRTKAPMFHYGDQWRQQSALTTDLTIKHSARHQVGL